MTKLNPLTRTSIFITSTVLFALLLSSCGKKSDSSDSDSGDDSSNASLVQSATSVIGDTLQGTSQSFIETYAQCSTQSFSSCSSGVRTRTLNGCERSNTNNAIALIYGTVTLTYEDNSCATGFTRTLSNHYAENESTGYKVIQYTQTGTVADKTISANDLKDFTGTTRSGGTTLSIVDSNTRSITINGVHRRGVRSSGLYGFWHTTYTTSPLTISRSSTEYTISSGTVVVAHNRLAKAVTHNFSNVVYPTDGSCCYPTSGTVTYTNDGQSIETVFSGTCGEVTIAGNAVTLAPCGAN